MSYYLGTAPTSGPPGPLRVPGVQLGAVEPHTHKCRCSLGDDVTAAGEMTKIVTISAVALGALWLMKKIRRRTR